MPQLYDLEIGTTFRWRSDIYVLESFETDANGGVLSAKVRCHARASNEHGWVVAQTPWVENFNPYAEVEVGELTLQWSPK